MPSCSARARDRPVIGSETPFSLIESDRLFQRLGIDQSNGRHSRFLTRSGHSAYFVVVLAAKEFLHKIKCAISGIPSLQLRHLQIRDMDQLRLDRAAKQANPRSIWVTGSSKSYPCIHDLLG